MKQKNRARRLSSRIADWALLMNSKNPESGAKEQRKSSGGYHKPGSNNK